MILLSAGGEAVRRVELPSEVMLVGSADGIHRFEYSSGRWSLAHRDLEGVFVSALTSLRDGTILAGTHGLGVLLSKNGGRNWTLSNAGLEQPDIWSLKTEFWQGAEHLFAGTQPAHLYKSDDGGASWRAMTAVGEVPSKAKWFFPPPPHFAHVLDTVAFGDKLLVGIEVGALLCSEDGGASFRELQVSDEISEIDIHRIIVHPATPNRIIVATGWGMLKSADGGEHWEPMAALPGIHYPVPIVNHPDDPNVLFVAGGEAWPPQWYELGRSRAKIARSMDGGRTWQRLLGGLPDGQRPLYGALSLEAWDGGFRLLAADSDGQIFESMDGGDRWSVVAEAGPVAKGEQYRGLAKGRTRLVGLDALKFVGRGKERVENFQG
jgi:photosystem II stability/assembly factor-like uncharacterized protein